MSDSTVATTAPAGAAATPAKAATGKKAAGSKKPMSKPAHPPTADMVNAAIAGLKERGGPYLQAIKKYITANYKVDAEKLAPFIKKYLKSAVVSGAITQPKGKVAFGSFKVSVNGEGKAAPAKKPAAPKSSKPKKAAAVTKPKSAATKKAAAPKTKTPSKAKKVTPSRRPKAQVSQTEESCDRQEEVPRTQSQLFATTIHLPTALFRLIIFRYFAAMSNLPLKFAEH